MRRRLPLAAEFCGTTLIQCDLGSIMSTARPIEAIGWALLLIWIGIALLAHIGWGWSLLGVGVIILGVQSALWRGGDIVDRFSAACGLMFLAAGIWLLLGLTWPVVPVLLILMGVIILWNAVSGAASG